MVTADEFGDPADVGLEMQVSGEPRQKARTKDLILSVPELIAFASSFDSLQPGDILMTGTPEGVGPVMPGRHDACQHRAHRRHGRIRHRLLYLSRRLPRH